MPMPSVRPARARTDHAPVRKRAKRGDARLVKGNERAVESPARQLQQDLSGAWRAGSREERWSARKTVGFIVVTCGLFWAAVAVAVVNIH
jgi:hypothetical protein